MKKQKTITVMKNIGIDTEWIAPPHIATLTYGYKADRKKKKPKNFKNGLIKNQILINVYGNFKNNLALK